ncbi:hotdog domain-containing protein [Gordonia sp. LSe1-13]|uniref:Acyl-coenzyme A thioesterase THEM4 n=1 Tax=Gordonia sesuvii TaxID=3116777 RepID=A0ABU7M965_9ACTN|nr:hotdog domain-containing protein [Gordonia sp. LSe1-13]
MENDDARARLVEAGRALVDAIGRTGVDDAALTEAADRLRSVEALLRAIEHERVPRITYDDAVGMEAYSWQRWNVVLPHLEMRFDGIKGSAELPEGLNELYEGPTGLLHGGISVVLIDALVTSLAQFHGLRNVTAGLTINFRKPTLLHTPLTVEAVLEEVHDRKVIVSGSLVSDGKTTVEATAVLVRVER